VVPPEVSTAREVTYRSWRSSTWRDRSWISCAKRYTRWQRRSVATSRGKYVERLLGAPNDERTRLGSNKLWQIELLELWLQTRGTRFPAQKALSTGNGRGTFSRASRSTQGFSARKITVKNKVCGLAPWCMMPPLRGVGWQRHLSWHEG
jgi:hypothetical protein